MIDPATVPMRKLYTGAKMPAVGLGTWGSDKYSGQEIGGAVLDAISAGYRHIDCAAVYGNEDCVGVSLAKAMQRGVRREELWITSKVWNNMHGKGDVLLSCAKSLRDLQLDYLDLFLIHWPFPNFHPPGCTVESRSADAKPYIHENYMKTWRQMEKLVDMGLVRNIGTSNMTIPKLELLLRDARIKPVCNEMELHPHMQQAELFSYCTENKVLPVGFCPVGSPSRPERDRTPGDTADMEDPVVVKIARDHGIHPAAVCIKWAVQRGGATLPFSVKRAQYISNLECVTRDPLSGAEMKSLAGIDKNCRLVKGQVFLWKDGQNWEDLWDVNGVITPA